jgi:hypothetical protein
MIKSNNKCKIDGVDIGEVSINLFGAAPSASVKYALINAESGVRYGAGTCLDWSPEVTQKLDELLVAMERHICVHVFGDEPTVSGAPTPDPTTDGVESL